MYQYAKPKEVSKYKELCLEIVHQIQDELKEYFTFDIRLIGSGAKNLVTKNGDNGKFDLDYDLIIKKDKKNLLGNPEKIKTLVMDALNKKSKQFGFHPTKNHTQVITAHYINNKQDVFSFDIAILRETKDNHYEKIINDKNTCRYIWNIIEKSGRYEKTIKTIKDAGKWQLLRDKYLVLKNKHLKDQEKIPSFSIYIQALNEVKKDI